MSEAGEWDFYITAIGDDPAFVFLDLSLARQLPTDRPIQVRVKVHFRRPRADGLLERDEYGALQAIEDGLGEVLLEAIEGRLVGRVTTRGLRDFVYYAPRRDGAEAAVQLAMCDFPLYRFETEIEEDPTWSLYLDLLCPTDRELQTILNRRVIDNLREHGDSLSVPREVDHHLDFPTREAREDFASEVEALGFTVTGRGDPGDEGRDEDGDDKQAWSIHLTRTHSVEWDTVNVVVAELVERARVNGGAYDGWGCVVVSGDDDEDLGG
jgi:regulator of RNase E activity RraB